MKMHKLIMVSSKKMRVFLLLLISLFFTAQPVFAAPPDGVSGPWADFVVSSNQGLMGSGLPVPAARSDPTSALGVAEKDNVDSHFFSLGFGGNIVLGFDNGISSGVFVVEDTNPDYPLEKARVEVSENNTSWFNAGVVVQNGTVTVPEGITCAKYVRITDISDKALFTGDPVADGYDVDGAEAIGNLCTTQPATATLSVIKQVINNSISTASSSDFSIHVKNSGVDVAGSPSAGTSTPGTVYSLNAGSYSVSEDASASSTATFSGDCDAAGNIALLAGDNKTCIVTNTIILPAPPATGGGGSVIITPHIGITKLPNPLALPGGTGTVVYGYNVFNAGGQEALTNIAVTDDKCSPVVFLSGDSNGNGKLDPGENWQYSCTQALSQTTTNTAIASGHGDNIFSQLATASAVSTVIVGSAAGGTASGTVPGLPNTGSSSGGSGFSPVPGFPNTGSVSNTTDTGSAGGNLNTGPGLKFPGAGIVPRFPNTGLPPEDNQNPWNYFIILGVMALVPSLLALVPQKKESGLSS